MLTNSPHWLLCACGRSPGGARSVRGAPAAEGRGAARSRSRGPAEGPLKPMSTEAEPSSLIRSFLQNASSVGSVLLWRHDAQNAQNPNPASTKALQARVCYPFSILRIDKHRQPSPFYTFLGLVYDNLYGNTVLDVLMQNPKKRTVKMR